MAADILAYRATHVPVGEDQKQHLELARDIAQKFNLDFADSIAAQGYGDAFFPQPEPLIQGPATRVMSLRDGSKKMSKSDPSDNSRINLADDADTIAAKIRKAKTDPEPLPSELAGLAGRPEADNLVGIFAALEHTTKAEVLATYGNAQLFYLQGRFGRSCRCLARANRRRDEAADRRSRGDRRDPVRRRRPGADRSRGRRWTASRTSSASSAPSPEVRAKS